MKSVEKSSSLTFDIINSLRQKFGKMQHGDRDSLTICQAENSCPIKFPSSALFISTSPPDWSVICFVPKKMSILEHIFPNSKTTQHSDDYRILELSILCYLEIFSRLKSNQIIQIDQLVFKK